MRLGSWEEVTREGLRVDENPLYGLTIFLAELQIDLIGAVGLGPGRGTHLRAYRSTYEVTYTVIWGQPWAVLPQKVQLGISEPSAEPWPRDGGHEGDPGSLEVREVFVEGPGGCSSVRVTDVKSPRPLCSSLPLPPGQEGPMVRT